jgi:glycosyltransferase involved in cell wall biosynthesis
MQSIIKKICGKKNQKPKNIISNYSSRNILVIDRHIPFFDKDAGSYRMYNLLKILQELHYDVTFIGDDFHHFEPYDSIFEHLGIKTIFSPDIKSIKQYLVQYGQYFKIVIVSRPDVALKHINTIRRYCTNAKVVYDTVDLRFLRLLRNAELKKDQTLLKKANKSKKIEMDLARTSDITLVVSSYEKDILLHEDPSLNIRIISLIYPISYPKKNFSDRSGILFVGGFQHSPNVDGVKWFIEEILTEITNKIPDIKFYVVGDSPPQEIQVFSSKGVIITGYISDLNYFFDNCRVFVAPLRYGAGIKGKICHSMSNGLPVVTTSIGAEGFGITHGYHAMIACDAADFSENVIRLYQDEKLWNSISNNSIEYIRQNYSYEKSKEDIQSFIESLL